MSTARLHRGERCPIHGSFFCCGREGTTLQRQKKIGSNPGITKRLPAVERVEDLNHPRKYRELCSVAELRRRKHLLISQAVSENNLVCVYCKKGFEHYREIQLCHRTPKGMGGSTHDDHFENLALGHAHCNYSNGSRRIA